MEKDFWEARWEEGKTGWDLGVVSPPIKSFIDELKDPLIEILIPGAGNAHEARYLYNKGFKNITVVDIAENLIDRLKKDFKDTSIRAENSDFFELNGKFDLIIEQTFFCAIRPQKRSAYALKMHKLLKKSGALVGVLFNCDFDGGPPFGGSKKEYEAIFSDTFHIKKMVDCRNSVSPRNGRELWIDLRPR
jgi:hypothetical protein